MLVTYHQERSHLKNALLVLPCFTKTKHTLNAHEAVLLGALEDSVVLQVLGVAGVLDVGLDPADVLAAPEAPLLEALASHVQPWNTGLLAYGLLYSRL